MMTMLKGALMTTVVVLVTLFVLNQFAFGQRLTAAALTGNTNL